MPVLVTQLEGDTMMLLEAETSGAFAKSEMEIRPNPMAAFDNSIAMMGTIGRIMGDRLSAEFAGGGIDSAVVKFGVKVDGAGSVLLAQEGEKAQFSVTLTVRTG
jgi:hypothetical protein